MKLTAVNGKTPETMHKTLNWYEYDGETYNFVSILITFMYLHHLHIYGLGGYKL